MQQSCIAQSVESMEKSAAGSYGPMGNLLYLILSMVPQLFGFVYKAKGLQASLLQRPFGNGPNSLLPHNSSLREDWGSVNVTIFTSNTYSKYLR